MLRSLLCCLALTACATTQSNTPSLRMQNMSELWARDSVQLQARGDSIIALRLRIAQLEGQIRGMGMSVPAVSTEAQSLLDGTSTTSTTRPLITTTTTPEPSTPRAPASGATRGPRGGCYVITGSGKKRYVDRSRC